MSIVRNEQVATLSFLFTYASQFYDFSATMLCRGISGRFRYAWIRKQDGRRRRNRDEILAEKLVSGREGYWAPGKFRKIFLALPPILDGSNISCGPTFWTFQDILRFRRKSAPLAVLVGSTFILAPRASLRGMHTAAVTVKTL